MSKKSIYELALEEIDKQKAEAKKNAQLPDVVIDIIKNVEESLPLSVPPNARRQKKRGGPRPNLSDIVCDGATNRSWGRARRNIQLD